MNAQQHLFVRLIWIKGLFGIEIICRHVAELVHLLRQDLTADAMILVKYRLIVDAMQLGRARNLWLHHRLAVGVVRRGLDNVSQ